MILGMLAQKQFSGCEATLHLVPHARQHICFHHSSSDRNSLLVHLSRNSQAGQNCVQIPISSLSWTSRHLRKSKMAASMPAWFCLESNSSSLGTGCEWSLSVLLLWGGPAESWIGHEPCKDLQRYFKNPATIFQSWTWDILHIYHGVLA